MKNTTGNGESGPEKPGPEDICYLGHEFCYDRHESERLADDADYSGMETAPTYQRLTYQRGSKEYNRVVSQSMEHTLQAWARIDSRDFRSADSIIALKVYSLRGFRSSEMPWVAAWLEGIRVAGAIIAQHIALTDSLRGYSYKVILKDGKPVPV